MADPPTLVLLLASMPLLALLTFTFAALVAGLTVGALLNRRAFERRRDAWVAELFAAIETLPTYYSEDDIGALPEPVRRYFARNLNEGMPHPSCARIRESGMIRTQPGQPWTEFEAQEYLVATPPGVVWAGTTRPFPLVWIDVLRMSLRGRAIHQERILSSIPSVDASDHATHRAALLRYVAALPLFPGAMLPGDDRGWSEHGEDSAVFTLRDGDEAVAGVFFFDELGNIVRFETETRPWHGPQQPASATWRVRFGEHRGFGTAADLQLPTKIDMEWDLDGQLFQHMDMRIEDYELDVPHAWSAEVDGNRNRHGNGNGASAA